MKKSKTVTLIIITATLASCNRDSTHEGDWENGNNTFVRSDSTAPYSRTHRGVGNALLWYMAFRPYRLDHGGNRSTGYFSGAIPRESNIGHNSLKGNVQRGGFGRSAFRVSS